MTRSIAGLLFCAVALLPGCSDPSSFVDECPDASTCGFPPDSQLPGKLILRSTGVVEDTIDAVLPSPLVVELQYRDDIIAAGQPVEFVGGPALKVLTPDGQVVERYTATTDQNGRVSVRVKFGVAPYGFYTLSMRAPQMGAYNSVQYYIKAGQPVDFRIISLTTQFVTRVGGTQQLRADAIDRAGNPVSILPATFTEITPDLVDIDAQGIVTGKNAGRAIIQATTSFGARTVTVDVVPGIRVLANIFSLRNGFLDNADWRMVGGVVAMGIRVDWSPTKQLIALEGRYPGDPVNSRHIFIADLAGNSEPLVPALRNSAGEYAATFSPDGQFVYYTARTGPLGAAAEIWRARLSDRVPERVGPVSTDRVDQYPSVSRDNRYVAYISNAKPVGDLMIIDLVTGQIRDTGIDAVYATWSPVHDDVLAVHLGTESGGIQIIRSDGTVLQRTDGIPISSPVDWSRDGRYLLASTGVLDLSTGVFLKHLINNVQLTWLD